MGLIIPDEGGLRELIVCSRVAEKLRREVVYLACWDLTERQVLDIELLLNGAFSPLDGFMREADYRSVCEQMRLQSGAVWPIPITLDVSNEFAKQIGAGDRVALRHPEGMVIAVLTVESIWKADLKEEARQIFGTTRDSHPGVFHLLNKSYPVYIGGKLEGLILPSHHTFKHLRHTPTALRNLFEGMGWEKVVAFQTRNPMHRAHVELTRMAALGVGAKILIHPVVGQTIPMDVDCFTRVRCYQAVLQRYPPQSVMLSLLPLAMRMAGPREALLHAIIRKNYGCSHLIVGRDHAGPGKDPGGVPFYPPYAAQELLRKYEREIGIEMLACEEMVFVTGLNRYCPSSEAPKDTKVLHTSGTELRQLLREGLDVPEWLSYPEVVRELRKAYPPRRKQGFTVFFTGLPAAGKSTVAAVLMARLMEIRGSPVTMLDGDIVRRVFSSDLGFSRDHRDLNIRRIGFVANEVVKNGGVAICALIAPYSQVRNEVRDMIAGNGGFIEVYFATPLEVCEQRDRKGLYAKARAGLIKNFTGINDPYEPPEHPDVVVDASEITPEEAANRIVRHLETRGFISSQQTGLRVDLVSLESSGL